MLWWFLFTTLWFFPSLGLFSYGVVLCGGCNVFFLHACWDCRFSRVPFPVVFLPWANAVAWLVALFIHCFTFYQSFVFTSFFRAMSYTIFRCKVSDSGARQGHTTVLLEKNQNKFGEGFPRSKFVQSREGLFFVGIPLPYGTFSCLAVISTVKFKY